MGNQNNTTVLDLSSYGDIIDRDGDMDLKMNFATLMHFMLKEEHLKTQKVEICISVVKFRGQDNPYRDSITKTYTYAYLLKKWKELYKSDFTLEEYNCILQEREWQYEMAEKEATRRGAWGQYSATIRQINEIEEERAFEKKLKETDYSQRENMIKERKKKQIDSGNMLVIG